MKVQKYPHRFEAKENLIESSIDPRIQRTYLSISSRNLEEFTFGVTTGTLNPIAASRKITLEQK